MSEYGIEKRSTEPKNFFAGEFPTVTETGTAGAALTEYTPITTDSDGNIIAVKPASGSGDTAVASTVGDVIGITAAAADKDAPAVYYMTGEYYEDAINLPAGVTMEELKPALRKINIYLR